MFHVAPPELLSRIERDWSRAAGLRRDSLPPMPSLPPAHAIEEILEAAFWASMRTEEKRFLSFRVAYCTPRELAEAKDFVGERRVVGGGEREALEFSDIVPLTPQRLGSLCPALDFRQALVAAACAETLRDEGLRVPESIDGKRVVIWGIIDTGLSWWEHTNAEPRRRVHRRPPPDCFTVSSRQAGTFDISCRGRIVLSVREGLIVPPLPDTLRSGPVGQFFADSARRLVDEVAAEIGADWGALDPETRRDVERYYGRFIERMLASMRELRHGGALVFLPDESDAEELLLFKFRTSASSTWSLLKDALVTLRRSVDIADHAFAVESVSREMFLEFAVTRQLRVQSEDRLRDRATLLASLTRVDGSLVLTKSLELVGFGAEVVTAGPRVVEVCRALDVEATKVEPLPMQRFGTRHRSAFRMCSHNPDALAIILSSDGGMRVVKRVGERVVVWNGLDTTALGL